MVEAGLAGRRGEWGPSTSPPFTFCRSLQHEKIKFQTFVQKVCYLNTDVWLVLLWGDAGMISTVRANIAKPCSEVKIHKISQIFRVKISIIVDLLIYVKHGMIW